MSGRIEEGHLEKDKTDKEVIKELMERIADLEFENDALLEILVNVKGYS